ncbi:MAG TPA: Gfo/Idh/MocA family oxidoreductase [Acidobacteriaceae bacterium]|jgi:predicted dehydrogenase
MNRREFTRLSALSLAAAPFAARPMVGQAGSGKAGFAVIGLGVIAKAFMEQVATSQTTEVVAFVTGDPNKGRQWAQQYNVPNAKIYSYDTMHEMQSNPAIQAVYVATPNGLHMRDTVASAKAGKHVLCEKPMATTPDECRAMIAACKAANVKLMIAYRMQYEPLHLKAKELIASGALGRIATIEGSFGFPIQPNVWRLTKKLAGGGPLVDVGIYPLNAIRFLMGEEPAAYTAMASTTDTASGRFKEVEESMVWTMKLPSGALATCSTSYGASLPGFLEIHGEKGVLDFQNAFGNGGVHLVGSGSAKMDESSPRVATQLRLEAEHLAECMHNNTTPRSPGEEGLRDHLIFAQLYKAAGVHSS